MHPMPSPTSQPEALKFDEPAPLYRVIDEGTVLIEPLTDLSLNLRAAIPHPWSETEKWIIGTVRGIDTNYFLDVGTSFGKLVLIDGQWKCLGLVRVDVIARSVGLRSTPAPTSKKFTDRLLKRSRKA